MQSSASALTDLAWRLVLGAAYALKLCGVDCTAGSGEGLAARYCILHFAITWNLRCAAGKLLLVGLLPCIESALCRDDFGLSKEWSFCAASVDIVLRFCAVGVRCVALALVAPSEIVVAA